MPNVCHGNGNLARDGCCYVEGQVCPLRWKVEGGHVYAADGTDLGTVDQFARSYTKAKPVQEKILEALQGRTFVCSVAARIIASDPSLLNDPEALEQAWDTDPEYVATVRPAWARIEDRLGLPPGAYNCSTWRGVGGAQCCFAETTQENQDRAAGLPPPPGRQIGVSTD